MKHETLAEKAQRTLAALAAAEEAAEKYNDFGSVMGIQDDIGQIRDDLHRALGSACVRATRLNSRIKAWESGERSVDMLRA